MKKVEKGEAVKIILKVIFYTGAIAIASTSPSFVPRIMPKLIKYASYRLKQNKKKNKKFYNAFYYLKNRGLVEINYKGKQMHISLTEEGKKKAKKYQIDDLKIKKPRKWDKKWRVLIFDISDKHKIKREALRGKLKELGLYQLQKSVWVCPYNFQKEIDILRGFFSFKNDEINIITASSIESDQGPKTFFGLTK
ncbi:CRISPR-associated endoribonuclease Cas2 [bacterium BMS3Abin15]|nr:CRISPR-associated endoribonuclease Cas2 [bacterium BMS3Abin15]HDH07806.1 hypothetical protein [Candidatus Moranbacteria bacterium]HDZ86048.1 hypothetical protein [Candidatus Moranbacteria bacterium]